VAQAIHLRSRFNGGWTVGVVADLATVDP